jgi:ABC-type glucose/galactose transport system permease subunit
MQNKVIKYSRSTSFYVIIFILLAIILMENWILFNKIYDIHKYYEQKLLKNFFYDHLKNVCMHLAVV